MTDQPNDRNKLTFSQAEGIDPLPQPVAVGELPMNARNLLWSYIYENLEKSSASSGGLVPPYIKDDPWRTILYDYHVSFLFNPADEFSDNLDNAVAKMKTLILDGDYNKVFDFLQFTMRHRLRLTLFRNFVKGVLEKFMCAYTIVDDGPTIVPIALPEQRESTQEAFRVLASGPFDGARSHLRKSAKCINDGDQAGSVRESIHAVESVARRLDQNASKSLAPALDALSRKGVVLHGAFKSGIENLYGYSSNAAGIRHALLEEQANVDTDTAVFMFGACASFSAYLVNKARKAGLPIEE